MLDEHPEYSQCFHAVQRLVEKEDRTEEFEDSYPPGRKPVYTISDFGEYNIMPSCASLTRNQILKDGIPQILIDTPFGDWVWRVLDALHGDIGYIDEVMGVYRIHAGGIMASFRKKRTENLQKHNELCEMLVDHIGPEYDEVFRPEIFRRNYKIARLYIQEGNWKQARKYADICYNDREFNRHFSRFQLARLRLRTHFPFLHRPFEFYENMRRGSGGKNRKGNLSA